MKQLIFLFLFFLLFSCSPKYEIKTIYKPPPTKKGKECIKICEKNFVECRNQCKKSHEKCLNEALKRAEDIYKKQLEDFKKEYEIFLKEYDRYLKEFSLWQETYIRLKEEYEFYKRRCFVDKKWCDEMEYYKDLIRRWEYKKPERPVKPQKPSYQDILKQQQLLCDKDCQCKEIYDICFQNCGGRIEIKKICIENCK
ncbi:MAG: hypothetical protein GXO21_01470 [Aquificae bacterium]|nr:hypothetical protein [Aquificota bacterium]